MAKKKKQPALTPDELRLLSIAELEERVRDASRAVVDAAGSLSVGPGETEADPDAKKASKKKKTKPKTSSAVPQPGLMVEPEQPVQAVPIVVDTPAPADQHRLARLRLRFSPRQLAALAVLALALVVGGVVRQAIHGPINLLLNGQPLHMSWQELERELDERAKATTIAITVDKSTTSLTPVEAGAILQPDRWYADLKQAQRDRLWRPWQLLAKYSYTPTITVDSLALENSLTVKGLQTASPVDANLVIEGEAVRVAPAQEGWGANVSALHDTLEAALSKLQPVTIAMPRAATSPRISTESATKVVADVEAMVAKPLSASGGWTPDRATRLGWISVVPDVLKGTLAVSQSEAKVAETVKSMIADVSIVKQDKLRYTMPDGSEYIATEGRNGKTVTNQQEIIMAWLAGKDAVVQFKEEPFAVVDGGLFTKLIVVDLDALRAYAYEGDVVVNSFPISGGKPTTPTPLGTFRIIGKTAVQTMCGQYDDGTYCTPNIRWISWFYPDYALHGAYWHNKFGVANVSHGCVNFRNDDSQWVYDWAPVGTPVIVRQTR